MGAGVPRKNYSETEEQRQARLKRIDWWWRRKFSYGGGDQFCPYNSQLRHPDFCHGLHSAPKDVFETLVFVAWKNQSWVIDATTDFLLCPLESRGMKAAALLRHLRELERRGLIHSRRGRYGKAYLVNPIGLSRKSAQEMKFFLEANLEFGKNQKDLFDRSETSIQIDQNDRCQGSFRSISPDLLSLEIDQNDPQYLDLNSSIGDAPRHTAVTASNDGKNSGPTGPSAPENVSYRTGSTPRGEKGVARVADDEIERRARERWAKVEADRPTANQSEDRL